MFVCIFSKYKYIIKMIMIQVNPDPDANDDAEIDIVKQIFSHSGASRSPSAPDIPAKFPDDR